MGLFDQIRQIKAVCGEPDNDIVYKGSFYITASFDKCVEHFNAFYPEGKTIKNLEKKEEGGFYMVKQDWEGNIRILSVQDEPEYGRCCITFDLNYPKKTHASKVFELMKSQMLKFVKPEKRVPVPGAAKPSVTTIQQPASQADELAKWKKLMDDGVITEEEFQAKKKQILGL